MRFIRKSPEVTRTLAAFSLSCYSELLGRSKQQLKEYLIKEQHGICCYCESRVTSENSHTEHIHPWHQFPEQQLNYYNGVCSCQKNLRHLEPKHCGMSKGDWFEEDQFVSPLNEHCEEHFTFSADGSILPAGDQCATAEKTIEVLNLNDPGLKARRNAVLTVWLDDELLDSDYLSFLQKTQNAIMDKTKPLPEFVSCILCVLRGNTVETRTRSRE